MAADTNRILNNYKGLVSSIGKAALHALYKNDFEYYMVSLELTDFDGNTIDFFSFPILPKSITKNENNRINVKKTYSGVTVINSKSFTPQEISMKGDFGRAFKILIESGSPTIFRAFRFSMQNGVWDLSDLDQAALNQQSRNFDVAVKTGYGCIKILQSIINKASGTDDKGRPFKLFLYNPFLGESYLVVPAPNAMVIAQNDSNQNMIHQYTLNLIAIAPISGNKRQGTNDSSNTSLLRFDAVQKTTSTFVSSLRSAI